MRRLLSIALLALAVMLPAQTSEAQYFRFGKNKVHYGSRDWSYLRTEHFDVYYYEGGADLAEFAAHAAEDAYEEVVDLFEYEPEGPIPLLVYTSHNAFAVTNAVELPTYADGIGGVTELFKNRIAVPFTGDYHDFRHVIHHELVHAVVNDIYFGGSIQSIISNNIQTRIPLWFNEGLAEYSAAGGWDTESDMYVREAILEDNLAPIDRLGGFFAYRGGQSVWDYIDQQYGQPKIAEILKRLRLTRSVEASFRQSIGLDLDELSERWQRSLKEVYFPEITVREDLNDIAKAIVTRREGLYNISPALSPQGDRMAYISTRSGLFDVYLVDTVEEAKPRRLIQGQTSTAFENFRILSPGMAWSPDGLTLAVAVKQGPSDALALIDVDGGSVRHLRLEGIEQIYSVAWHPDGTQLAVSASSGAQSDIYLVGTADGTSVNLTQDVYSDHEPVWSPDGRFLVFVSDRGERVILGRDQPAGFPMQNHDYRTTSLYRLEPGSRLSERLTEPGRWKDNRPQFGPDPNRLLFISDRNGIPNLYEKSLTTGQVRPVTDLTVGVMQMSLSASGQRVALVSLREGTPSIYLLRTPFQKQLGGPIRPNLWALRSDPGQPLDPPALALAGSGQRRSNPYLRAALASGDAASRGTLATSLSAAGTAHDSALPARGAFYDSLRVVVSMEAAATPASPVAGPGAPLDTVGTSTSVDYRNYTFTRAFSEAARRYPGQAAESAIPERAQMNEAGQYRPQRYKLDFSPDIVHGAAGYDALYGVQGVTQMVFSDMLGNHRIVAATNLLIDLRNSDYILSYDYLPRRVDWSVSGFHLSRLLADFQEGSPSYFRYRQYGVSLAASYPLSKFRRLDTQVALIGVNQTDITDALRPEVTQSLLVPSVTFTRDVTTPGYLFPTDGSRMAFSLSGSPMGLGGRPARFISLLGDVRSYSSTGSGAYVLALRASGAASFGPQRQVYYTSGVMNWINRTFDDLNGLPIEDASDFVLATPILPLRGFDINARNGSYFGLLNAEFRFPLVAAMLPGPVPFLPLYNLQGQVFTDVGAVWGGGGPSSGLNLRMTNESGEEVFDDLLLSAGFGFRTILLGYPIRFDFAWPHDGQRFGKRKTYISLGLDF